MTDRTVVRSFADTVARQGEETALRRRGADGTWQETTWGDYAEGACRVASGLAGLGLRRGERVALMLRNRPEFHLADLGSLLAGATPLSIYNSSPPEQVAALLGHSKAAVAVVEDAGFGDRVAAVRDRLPDLRHVIGVDGEDGARGVPDQTVVPWASLLEAPPVDLDQAAGAVAPTDLATVIYTSGTTGAPKGVKRISTHYLHVTHGTVVSCCPDLGALPQVMAEVHPNWWFCAPRMWRSSRPASRRSSAGTQRRPAASPTPSAPAPRSGPRGRRARTSTATWPPGGRRPATK